MNVRSFAVVMSSLTLLGAVACAPDEHGDLRSQVVIEDEGGYPRVTYRGVGVGMERQAAFEVLGERPDPLFGGSWLVREQAADFGTRLDVIYSTSGEGHVIEKLSLDYTGNRVAIGKVWDRWVAALRLGERGCVEDACYWDDGEAQVASIRRERGWTGRDELSVTLYR